MSLKAKEYAITVNDRRYDGDFDLENDEGLIVKNLKAYGPEAPILNEATRTHDVLLLEYIQEHVEKYVNENADQYEALVPKHLEYRNDGDL